MLICDVDNVGVDEARRFGARERRGSWRPRSSRMDALPSTDTDRYSLAVLLFYVLMVQHPLEGKAALAYDHLDSVEALAELTGRQPGVHLRPRRPIERAAARLRRARLLADLPPAAPPPVHPRLHRGSPRPARRVTVGEWRSAMARLCEPARHLPVMRQAETLRPRRERPRACWSCATDITIPPRLHVGHQLVMLNADTVLYPHHLDARPFDYAIRVAEVAAHPSDPSRWGLRNLGDRPWRATMKDGSVIDIPAGRALPLVDGAEIDFGGAHTTRGSIVA